MEMPKDYDVLLPQSTLFLTLLRPVKLPRPLLLEISPPNIKKKSAYFGGPSLEDIQAVLRSNPVAEEQGTIAVEPIQFRVEMLGARSPQRQRPRRDDFAARRTGREVEEDEEIVEALRQLGGGFFGGFEGVADRLRHLARKEETLEEEEDWVPSAQHRGPPQAATGAETPPEPDLDHSTSLKVDGQPGIPPTRPPLPRRRFVSAVDPSPSTPSSSRQTTASSRTSSSSTSVSPAPSRGDGYDIALIETEAPKPHPDTQKDRLRETLKQSAKDELVRQARDAAEKAQRAKERAAKAAERETQSASPDVRDQGGVREKMGNRGEDQARPEKPDTKPLPKKTVEADKKTGGGMFSGWFGRK